MEQLLLLFHKFSNLVQEAFHDDPRFLTARDKAYKQVVNDTTVFRLELPSKQVSGFILYISNSQPGVYYLLEFYLECKKCRN